MTTSAAFGAAGEFAASHHGVLTRSQAAGLGLSARSIATLLRRGLVREVLPGVLSFVGSPTTWHQRVYAATLASAIPLAASHRCSAAVHCLDGFAPDAIELVTRNGSVPKFPGVLVHQSRTLEARDIVVVDGIRTTGLARTLCDLGDVVPPERVLQALDDVQRRGVSLRWLLQTAERLDTPARAGPRLLRELVAERIDGYRLPDSWFERLLEAALDSPVLAGLVRQHEVRDRTGRVVARLDLAIPRIRLGIEAHSRRFHLGRDAERSDERRDLDLAKLGWEVIYLGFAAIRTPAETCRDLEAVVLRRAADVAS